MHYTDKAFHEIEQAFKELRYRHIKLVEEILPFANAIENPRAKEYFLHGVCRRVFIINKCAENIFRIFPPDREQKLTEDEHYNAEINLHCFLINIYGIIENIALSMAFENGFLTDEASAKSKKNEIGLFNKKFKSMISQELKEYINNPEMITWYNQYAKNYRDALAHRIPPYIPPSGLDKEDRKEFESLNQRIPILLEEKNYEEYSITIEKISKLGKASPFFTHSFSEESKQVYIHPQIIADFRTVEELLNTIIKNFKFKEKE